MKIQRIVLLVTFVLLWSVPGLAQFELPEKSRFELSLFGWGAGTDGSVGFDEVSGGVDLGFFDLVDNADFGGGVYLRAKRARWGWIIGLEYLDTKNDEDPGVTLVTKSIVSEFDLTYEVREGLDVLIGARYFDVEAGVALFPFPGVVESDSGSDAWIDPIIGLRWDHGLSPRWGFVMRADVGGFGLVSDITWQITPAFGFEINDRWRVAFGYRILDVEYDDSQRDSSTFVYDIQQRGPFVGGTFSWGGGPKN